MEPATPAPDVVPDSATPDGLPGDVVADPVVIAASAVKVEPAADVPAALPPLEPAAGVVPEESEVAAVSGPAPALPEVADDLPTHETPPAEAEQTGTEPTADQPAQAEPIIVGAPVSVPPVEAAEVVEAEEAAAAEVVEAEVVDEADPAGSAAEQPEASPEPGAADQPEAAEEGRGLGWLLSMSGLGAVTPEPDSAPVSPAAAAPVSAPAAAADAPVSGAAPGRTDWFAPSTETEVVEPRTEATEPPQDTAEETPSEATAGDTPAEATASDTPAEATAEETPAEAEADAAAEAEETAAEEPVSDAVNEDVDEDAVDEPDGDTASEHEEPDPDTAARRTEKAVRAPSMQLPTISVAPPPEPELEPERRLADPEQVLAAYPWKVDPVTLRETAGDLEPLRAVRDRLTDKLEYAERDAVRARLLSLRAVVSRVLGEYGRALADGREALRHAEASGDLRQTAIVQARLAHVQQWRGDYAEADRLYEEANSVELPGRLRAEMHVNAGKSGYDQGRYLEACNHFELALELRRVEDPDLVARTEAALDAVMARVQETGWGPYPRSREEILQQSRPPQPAQDYETGLFGYADSNGDVVVPEVYAEAQPFREGAAWVRRPDAAAWELIDETGTRLLDDSSAYLQAQPFSDGLAWVSREPAGGWFAVDWHNRVIVPGGFDEVRPFRRGVAAVRRGGWGALDRHGRIVVQLKYRGFATALTGGGPVDGFTEEGLAVVDAGGRFGVVDRAGRLLVRPVHAELLIHPAAYLIRDVQGRWGALDRDGDPLVDVTHPEPADVVREIDRLLSETRPVL